MFRSNKSCCLENAVRLRISFGCVIYGYMRKCSVSISAPPEGCSDNGSKNGQQLKSPAACHRWATAFLHLASRNTRSIGGLSSCYNWLQPQPSALICQWAAAVSTHVKSTEDVGCMNVWIKCMNKECMNITYPWVEVQAQFATSRMAYATAKSHYMGWLM
mgnify:CR=1 FL=1